MIKILDSTRLSLFALLLPVLLFSCKNNDATKIGEIYSNDNTSNKIIAYFKALEAKDSVGLSEMVTNDFEYIHDSQGAFASLVDNKYFKDTSNGYNKLDKKNFLIGISNDFQSYDSSRYENPKIFTFIYFDGDTITTVNAFYKAVSKSDKSKIHIPYKRIFKWKEGKIHRICAVDEVENKWLQDLYNSNYGYSTTKNDTSGTKKSKDDNNEKKKDSVNNKLKQK